MKSGTLTSIDDEMEHTQIAKLALQDADIEQSRFRLITNSIPDVMTKLTDRAYDLVVLRHNPEDLSFVIGDLYERSKHVFSSASFVYVWNKKRKEIAHKTLLFLAGWLCL